MMEEELKRIEETDRTRMALESQEGVLSQNPKGGKTDPKKDKGKASKNAAAEDKNAPKHIEIEYPEVESEPSYLIMEKSFLSLKQKPEVKKPVKSANA